VRFLEGEAAREDAREDATMALARESIVAASELIDTFEAEVRRRFCSVKVALKEGL
jgi:hypothetical protein